ncbi:RlpA-like double-psi beta-barrel-protein domain-containing protein-containing protein [Lineolata rhizophorae]|uniref:cellulase n=1 Tax=Lineolata rhizophorae TaxID=578093 RepID=A0A6A6NM11_9PEZI|nr:RlpA-like double-psi beta-barrel-protein domain-containing protein-containing protein [Lineolata rhizophorae]
MDLIGRGNALKSLALVLAASRWATADSLSGSARTERYWDCCKPSCSWSDHGRFMGDPVESCGIDDAPLTDFTAGTGCNGGSAYSCATQSPWAVNDTFSYGFVGVYIDRRTEDHWCCSCYHLNFTEGPVAGKTMIVQAHNSAYDTDIDDNKFTIAVPGGNTSFAGACSDQYGVPESTFGVENQGVRTRDDCQNLPEPMIGGCMWRFDWYENAENPRVDFKRVSCPSELINITGCIRRDENDFNSTSSASLTRSTSHSLVASLFMGGALAIFLQLL